MISKLVYLNQQINKNKIENISIDAHLKQKLGGKPLMLTDRQIKIIEYIQKIGYLQNKAFESLFPMVAFCSQCIVNLGSRRTYLE